MARHDDPAIAGDIYLLRRIPPWGDRVTWTDTGPAPSSQNFKDRDEELSVHIEQETNIDELLSGHSGFGVLRIRAGDVRDVCGQAAILCRDPPPAGHVLICGKLTGGMRNQLKRLAEWVRWPDRDAPPPEEQLP